MKTHTPNRNRLRRFGLATLTFLLATAGLSIATAVPASAAQVWSYGNPVIMVDTGAKNNSNHTQYVSDITIVDPGSPVCDGGTYEAWAGSVWYASRVICTTSGGGTMNSTTFYINTWVPSGSGVCGSFWRNYQFGTWPFQYWKWMRNVSCITITV
jgi:hypothetical protein